MTLNFTQLTVMEIVYHTSMMAACLLALLLLVVLIEKDHTGNPRKLFDIELCRVVLIISK